MTDGPDTFENDRRAESVEDDEENSSQNLKGIWLLEGLPDDARTELEGTCHWNTIPAGQTVVPDFGGDANVAVLEDDTRTNEEPADRIELLDSYTGIGEGRLCDPGHQFGWMRLPTVVSKTGLCRPGKVAR